MLGCCLVHLEASMIQRAYSGITLQGVHAKDANVFEVQIESLDSAFWKLPFAARVRGNVPG